MIYHKPVLLNECIQGLNVNPNGIYVDATFGGGGHSKEILKMISNGRLIAFDRDLDAQINIINNKSFKLLRANYKHIKRYLRHEGITEIDGILVDLGVSSHQLDFAERGFSFRFDSKLDMRMDTHSHLTAEQILNEYTKEQLSNIFYQHGDLKQSRKLADKIISARRNKKISKTFHLVNILEGIVPAKRRNKFFSQVFQSLRIEVNEEIESLKLILKDGVDLLKPNGRFVVVSYHSIEDRIVKNWFKRGDFHGEVHQDIFGNTMNKMREINRKVIIPSKLEVKNNNRSRSSKLRIAEKI